MELILKNNSLFKIAGSDKFTLDPSGNMTISVTVPSKLTGALPAVNYKFN